MMRKQVEQALVILAAAVGATVILQKVAQDAPGGTWQALADKWADYYGVWRPIVLATVEAETGGNNVAGDGGQALGYGQVWPYWHQWAFDRAAKDLGMTAADTHSGLSAQVAANPDYSMAVAALVVKSMWETAGGSTQEEKWEDFTRHYVGPAIPDRDMERRRLIWHKYS